MASDTLALSEYAALTRAVEDDAWREKTLRRLAEVHVPQTVMGHHGFLLDADIKLTWTNWFVDGLVDRSRFVRDTTFGYPHLYSDVVLALRSLYPSDPLDELQEVAKAVSELAWDDVARLRAARRRPIPKAMREDLWYAAEPDPRCYLCGYKFAPAARDRFLGRAQRANIVELPLLVDFTRPRGLKERDISIEVDHVAPVAAGGASEADNLRLACGWCNRVKSDKRSILDAPAKQVGVCSTSELGDVAVPQPIWVLRIIATRGRCEHPDGCSARLDANELFIAARSQHGSLTPTNALVVCGDHDPWATARWVGRGSACFNEH
jgi:hypothetical protein